MTKLHLQSSKEDGDSEKALKTSVNSVKFSSKTSPIQKWAARGIVALGALTSAAACKNPEDSGNNTPAASASYKIGTASFEEPLVVMPKYQDTYFPLGKSDIPEGEKLDFTKLHREYVYQITGEVDVTDFSDKEKSAEFYEKKVTESAELLLKLYTTNKRIFTPDALGFIEANLPQVRAIEASKPKTHAAFENALSPFSRVQVLGPEGVLNLLLAFNRVTAKLKPASIGIMSDSQSEQGLMINLRKIAERKNVISVDLFTPEIKEPDISKIFLDIPDVRIEKRMKPNGTFEVKYWRTDGVYDSTDRATRKIITVTEELVILDIDPKTKTVKITTHFNHLDAPYTIAITFAQFDDNVKKNPSFIHSIYDKSTWKP